MSARAGRIPLGARAAAVLLVAIVLASVAAPLLAGHDYAAQRLTEQYLPPGEHGHLLGTDLAGRDLWSRLLYGSRISLLVAFAGTLVSVLIGVAYGAVSGYVGGRLDAAMMRLLDVLYSLPFLFLVVLVMTLLVAPDASAATRVLVLLLVLGAVQWMTMARIVRGQVLSLKHRDYVHAARALGAGPARILFLHIVPNLLPIVLVYATLTVPRVMLQEAFLSFLGLGIPEPFPSWGRLVADGVRSMTPVAFRWWLTVFPAAAITGTLLLLNLLGQGMIRRSPGDRSRHLR